MLKKLYIENIAIIDKLEIDFDGGFTILTGETGAGKSIIIDSLSLLLGVRMNKDIIRTSTKKAIVSAIFDINKDNIANKLSERGIFLDENQLIITREIHSNGKNICKINDQYVTISFLKDITKHIFEIHGQSETYMLNDKKVQLSYLDRFCGDELDELKKEYHNLFYLYQSKAHELKQLLDQASDKERKLDIINFQLNEIESISPLPNEDKELEDKKNIIQNISKIKYNAEKIYQLLSSNILEKLELCIKLSSDITKYDNDFVNINERLNNVYYEIEDITLSMSKKNNSYSFDQFELENIIERLDKLNRLKKKYGGSIDSILQFKDELIVEKNRLQDYDIHIEGLKSEVDKIYNDLFKLAEQISLLRKKAAIEFEKSIIDILDQLEMKNVDFKIILKNRELYEDGFDEVEFLLSTNPGQELKPMSLVASGGELSRIMLAIKSLITEKDEILLVIFDEIDMGLSGIAATKLAKLLKSLSKTHQVICVTHLPQVAAAANLHYYVYKELIDGVSFTRIKCLNEDESLKEIARMFSGENITENSIKHALELKSLF